MTPPKKKKLRKWRIWFGIFYLEYMEHEEQCYSWSCFVSKKIWTILVFISKLVELSFNIPQNDKVLWHFYKV